MRYRALRGSIAADLSFRYGFQCDIATRPRAHIEVAWPATNALDQAHAHEHGQVLVGGAGGDPGMTSET
jgi:hypothetical protein